MNNRIKNFASYIGVGTSIIALLFNLGYALVLSGAVIFLIFRFGKMMAEIVFVLAGLFFMITYFYYPNFFQWKYVIVITIGIALMYYLSPDEEPKKKIESECPRCNGTGKDFYYPEHGKTIEIQCTLCSGIGKIS